MKKEKTENKSIYKFVFLTTVITAVSIYAWMILLHAGVQIYETKRLGSAQLGQIASTKLFNESTLLAFITYVGMELVMLLSAYLLLKKREKGVFKLEYVGMTVQKNSYKHVMYGFIIATGMYVVIHGVLLISGLEIFKGYGMQGESIVNVIGTTLLVFLAMAFPGFCEEIVFRGIIQNYLMKKTSVPLAILITSICFAIMHIGRYPDVLTLLFIIAPGVVFGYLFVKTKSLYLSIGLHYAYDFFGSIMGEGLNIINTKYLLVFESKGEGKVELLVLTLTFIGVLFIAIIKYRKDKKTEDIAQ